MTGGPPDAYRSSEPAGADRPELEPFPTGREAPRGRRRTVLLVGGVVALVIVLAAVAAFVVNRSGDDDAESRTAREDDESRESDDDTDVVDTGVDDTLGMADGRVAGLFVHIAQFGRLVPDDEVSTTLQRIAADTDDNPVSTTGDVANLCAAVALDESADVGVEWRRDDAVVSSIESIRLASPADGSCINNDGAPLDPGTYEVVFTDADGGQSSVAAFTVGAATVSQTFLNDTGADVCSVDVGPASAGYFQSFELDDAVPLPAGESIVIDIADVEHEAQAIDCGGQALESLFFTPSADEISLANGSVATTTTSASTTSTAPAPVPLSDIQLTRLDGEIASLDVEVVDDADRQVVFDTLSNPDGRLRIATTDISLTLCVVWNVPGYLEADIVWEFNKTVIAELPSTSVDGRIGSCVPPAGDAFDDGAYQAYVRRGEVISTIETFTVGREETQLAFVNDTGVEICELGFSPTLTNFYTFYTFAESDDFDEALAPDEAFTIAAPMIENDIRARDCDGNNVAEASGIAPTDQTLRLTTGQP